MDIKLLGYNLKIGKSEDKKSFGYTPYSQVSQYTEGFKITDQVYFDLYRKNGDIRQCISKISQSVSRNGIYLVDNKNGEVVENPEVTAQAFSYFNMPTFGYFKKELYKQYMIGGELYIVPVKNEGKQVVGFEILDMRSMRTIYDAQGNIIGYVQTTSTGKYKAYPVDEISYFQYESDVDNPNEGMSLIASVVYDALSDTEATKRNFMFFKNGASLGKAIVLKDGLTKDEQRNALEQFNAQQQGTDNSFKTLMMGGIDDIKEFGLSHRDMDFINQRKLTIEKVSSLFGVPKSILGYVDTVNYSNAVALRQEYLEGTIRPLEWDFKYIMNILMVKFVPEIGEKYTIIPDGENAEDVIELEKGQREDVKLGLRSIDEIRIDRGLDPYETDESTKPLITKNMMMLEDIILDPVVNFQEGDPNK